MANADDRPKPPANVTGIRQKPHVTVTMVHDRHFPGRLGKKIFTHSGPEARTTLIEPWVDVQGAVDAINRGEAIVDHGRATGWLDGRRWGYHTDTGPVGRLYPQEGPGFLQLENRHVRAIEKVIEYNGLNAVSERFLAKSPHLSDADRDLVRHVWRIRERERRGR